MPRPEEGGFDPRSDTTALREDLQDYEAAFPVRYENRSLSCLFSARLQQPIRRKGMNLAQVGAELAM